MVRLTREPAVAVRRIHRDESETTQPEGGRGFMDQSVGNWEGQKLVVDTTRFKEGHIGRSGAPQSGRAHLVERFTRDGDFLLIMITLADPVYLTQPFTRVIAHRYVPDLEIREARIASPELGRFLYTAVGRAWGWTDRLSWPYSKWLAHLERPEVAT